MSEQVQASLRRGAMIGVGTFLATFVAALLAGQDLRMAALLGAAGVAALLTGRTSEGLVDQRRAKRGELIERSALAAHRRRLSDF